MNQFWSRWIARCLTPILLAAIVAVSDQAPADARSNQGRLTVCSGSLCRDGRPWQLYMASVYQGLDNPSQTVAEARAIGLDAIRITDYLDVHSAPAVGPYDPARWARVDRLIAAAGSARLLVVLDLSTYRNLLKTAGLDPYTVDWSRFLQSVADRRNTVTGVRYRDDPTIGMVSFAGEVDAINSGENTYGLTAATLVRFYSKVLTYWHHLAPGQLRTAGGLYQLDWNSGIPWKAIFALPGNDVDAVHVYGPGDRSITVPAVADFSRSQRKPWIIEEFGFDAQDGDRARAEGFNNTFALASTFGAAGVGFWNLGSQTGSTYDVGPQFPQAMNAVMAHTSTSGAVRSTR
jgi:hypothetical protein